MEPVLLGELIRSLRHERGLTQRELAQQLCVTDKAVSKWERGSGCPDVDSLGALAQLFRVELHSLLAGTLPKQPAEGGNMKRMQFYLCPHCGNVLTAAAPADLSCCGYRLDPLRPQPAAETHLPRLQITDGDLCVSFAHEMCKEHFIRFVALITNDRMTLVRLYPEQDALLRLPYARIGTLLFACSQHGLMSADLRTLFP